MNSAEVASSDGYVGSVTSNHANFVSNKTPAKLPKPPKAPEKPLMPYMRYSREIWESVKTANPEQKLSEIGRTIGRMWRELPQHEKQRYISDYDVDKVKYAEAFKIYQNSPAYQQYLAAKDKYHVEEKETKTKSTPIRTGFASKAEPRITLPACDSDEMATEELDYFHLRQLAAARFHRNQRLLQELFSEACVPDMRQIITVPRLLSLKRQVETLTLHQKKIDTEVNQLVETFEAKKRRLEEGTRDFHLLLEKCTKPAVTAATFENLVEQAEHQLLEKYKAFVKNSQQAATAAPSTDSSSAATSTLSSESINGNHSVGESSPSAEDGEVDCAAKAEPNELPNGEIPGVEAKASNNLEESNPAINSGHVERNEPISNGSVNGISHDSSE